MLLIVLRGQRKVLGYFYYPKDQKIKQEENSGKQNKIDKKCFTTAWFFEMMHKWFCVINCHSTILAVSHSKEEEYSNTISFLKEVMFVIETMKVDKNEYWKPFQTGILLATQTVLDIQDTYIIESNLKYPMLGRFTQDALENLFSNVRSRNPVRNAKEFKTALRLIHPYLNFFLLQNMTVIWSK